MRIVGGWASGLRIEAPPGQGTRPTTERVREAIFNSLRNQVEGARVLDLYAGSGAMALESVSWGAASSVAVEPNRKAQMVIRANIERVNMSEWVRLWPGTAESAVGHFRDKGHQFDLVICDPPWKDGLSATIREGLQDVLAPEAWVVVEHPTGQDFGPLMGTILVKTRRYGDTTISYWTRS
ncbi:MAG: 16S rRNA (guanine(966)-N(2))-methyltransferase RsmD [Sulfobacillus thermotolerans]|uniref:16S rRNA (Guanine(966)-N(2))-methyltransferase RsmD n=1 Tax=Sulfobacillus thermotolerans TaxID=338644 RepID=A0ABM6RT47_9FIRM|nr:16S rRNA (guanine(966)-N(2))-methyltransferase RsmD [Sulfobacillus thermotolerans]MCY0908046.1 16S rRNA (guanine(966)-N(2))-methyltransferase RsmD [Sulfobacillus thermotolerans]